MFVVFVDVVVVIVVILVVLLDVFLGFALLLIKGILVMLVLVI
jgi:hypothetical protein